MLFLSSFEACLYIAGLNFELPFVLGRFHIFAGKVNTPPSAGSFVFFVDLNFSWFLKRQVVLDPLRDKATFDFITTCR